MAKPGALETGGCKRFRKTNRREKFPAEMEAAAPWNKLEAVIEPHYPRDPWAQGRLAAPAGLLKILKIHCLQH